MSYLQVAAERIFEWNTERRSSRINGLISEIVRTLHCEFIGPLEKFGSKCDQSAEVPRLDRVVERCNYYLSEIGDIINKLPVLSVEEQKAVLERLVKSGATVDEENRIVSMVTDRIVLEGIDLGPFRVSLYYGDPGYPQLNECLFVEALDPNPAASNERIYHPHVSGERLCLGDALVPAGSALVTGRLDDLFDMVNAVLHTYNPRGAYVELSNWEAVECGSCGTVVADFDRCENCSENVCSDCIVRCCVCCCLACLSCSHGCKACRRECCNGCDEACYMCGSLICRDCILTCNRCRGSMCCFCSAKCACNDVICRRCVRHVERLDDDGEHTVIFCERCDTRESELLQELSEFPDGTEAIVSVVSFLGAGGLNVQDETRGET